MQAIKRTALASVMLLAFCAGGSAQDRDEGISALLKARDALQGLLDGINADLSEAAKVLSRTGLSGSEAHRVISDLYKLKPAAVLCETIGPEGTIAAIEPSEFKVYEGGSAGVREREASVRETRRPVLSRSFRTPAGFDAITIASPVFSATGEFIGSVGIMFKPEALLASAIVPALRGISADITVVQTDGRVLYDRDSGKIGKRLFADPSSAQSSQIISLLQEMGKERAGSGSLDYINDFTGDAMRKQVSWATVGLYGVDWRVVAASTPAAEAGAEGVSSARKSMDALIKSQVQTAVSMLQAVYERFQKGEIGMEEAMRTGADLLRALRYGDDNEGYFWADTTEGVNVVLYGRKDVEGTNRYDALENGVYYVREFIAKGKQPGGGYTDYHFPRMGKTEPIPKRSYSLLFRPFRWIVGTGYYIDDLEKPPSGGAKGIGRQV